jgi:hypothetical protein
VYPFERFTELAKKTLTLAQQEAERSHHSYIGTEHLLLGVLRNEEGLGYRVLEVLGVRIDVVRQAIESVVGRNERSVIQQIIPTSRVKKVIELAFEEAQRMGHQYVGTEHLLLGLVIEGEGIAARVLDDLGATVGKVRHEIERQLAAAPTHMPGHASGPAILARDLSGADTEALLGLVQTPHLARLLESRGLDVGAVQDVLLHPPDAVVRLRRYIADLRKEMQTVIGARDFEKAWRLQQGEKDLRKRLAEAERECIDGLQPR